jgi:exonuclease III
MGNKFKEESLRDIIKSKNLYVLLIQETKVEDMKMLEIGKKEWKNSEGVAVRSREVSLRICALWDNIVVKLEHVKTTRHWILTRLIHQTTCMKFHVFKIYMPSHYKKKEECWHSLQILKDLEAIENGTMDKDFIMTLSNKENIGGDIVRGPFMENMEDLTTNWDLDDIKPVRWKYT